MRKISWKFLVAGIAVIMVGGFFASLLIINYQDEQVQKGMNEWSMRFNAEGALGGFEHGENEPYARYALKEMASYFPSLKSKEKYLKLAKEVLSLGGPKRAKKLALEGLRLNDTSLTPEEAQDYNQKLATIVIRAKELLDWFKRSSDYSWYYGEE